MENPHSPTIALDPPRGDEQQWVVARIIDEEPIEAQLAELPSEPLGHQPPRSRVRRVGSWMVWFVKGSFSVLSLVVLLAVLTAIPLLQLIAFGYLLDVAGRLVNGARLSQSLPGLPQVGRMGLAATAILLASLPTQLLVHWGAVAEWIDPGSSQATMIRWLAISGCFAAMGYLMWAWVRGGRLHHYLWPQPIRLLKEGWRRRTWQAAADRLWEFTASLEVPRLFWLGLRGAVGTLIWLVPAMVLIAANRNGESEAAGVVGLVCIATLGVALMYLPMLQAHFAAENRLSALFEVRTIRRDFRRAPWAWFLAMVIGLVLMPIPLYLLKIEATPREVLWLPCLVFVAFILPARIAEGLALRRARRANEPQGIWPGISRWTVRLLMPAVVGVYLVFVQVSQYTSWDGLQTWIQQHAILVPVPFVGV
ncbi:DUF4013 domain-containing protein [Novipirellula artificiosorum]|uniref:DUF4013 domain-containing protein n=1 Tax=Novipirellula artificiosorum TaxID=2528016 RepID=A0A5C6DVT0_9BACT|nr:DUF4013 domain-containing protein [Novipirellula artificiosorum]TWU40758.1 hypothetical protein Poly41_15930 [Novipirellula artificiosorum]